MFGRRKPIVFDRYHRQRKGWRPPRWLLLLALGGALGVASVIYAQERLLPPRLSAAESQALHERFAQADAERARLQAETASLQQRVQAAEAQAHQRATELAGAQQAAAALRDDLEGLVRTLPPDPRGGDVEVRAAHLSAGAGTLDYDLVLTRKRGPAKPLNGVLKLVVAGATRGGKAATITLEPVAVQLGRQEVISGSAPLPPDFTPRETTVHLLDRAGGRALGMRVLRVDNA